MSNAVPRPVVLATITEDPSVDMSGVVFDALRARYPGHRIEIEYGNSNECEIDGEIDDEFHDFVQDLWNDLCDDANSEYWVD